MSAVVCEDVFACVNTLTLDGPALDWLAALALGLIPSYERGGTYGCPDSLWFVKVQGPSGLTSRIWSPRTDWSDAGPFLSDFVIAGGAWLTEQMQYRAVTRLGSGALVAADAGTLQVAVMRAYVAARLGLVMRVPAELVAA